MGLAKVTLIGNIGGEPETRYTQAGKMFTSFSLACGRSYMKDGERVEETEWFRCTCWGNTAEVASKYLNKGSKVYIEGRFSSRAFTGKDGAARYSLEVNVTELQMLSPKKEGDDGRPAVASRTVAPAAEEWDSIPF